MRIGIDARLWHETGVGRYIRNLVENLLRIDTKNNYVLFTTAKVCEELKMHNTNVKISGKKLQLVPTNIKWHSMQEQFLFPKILEKEKLDLVHFPYFSVPIYYNRPFVITIHDLIINHYPTGKASTLPSPFYYLKLFGYKFVIQKAAQKAKKVIAVSQATKDEIVEHLHIPEDKVFVTYEGVEKQVSGSKNNVFGGGVKDDILINILNSKYILYVGNAYPHKNLDRLVEAFSTICKEFSDIRLVLVGTKNYFYDRLEKKVVSLNLKNNIYFTGRISDEELVSFYQNAQALVSPSVMEGFGLPGLEAMQSGCPVLASDIPAFREIYQDAVVYFNPLDVTSMHDKIREVLTDHKKFLPQIVKGKKRIAAFSWEKMAEQTLKIYEDCVSLRPDQ